MKNIPLALIVLLLFSCIKKEEQTIYSPPTINKSIAVDNYFGTEVKDPYRNIENTQDSTITQWYRDQTDYASNFMDRIKGRDAYVDRAFEMDNRRSFHIKQNHITENDNHFYLKKNKDEEYYKLYYKNVLKNKETLLFDPRTYNIESGNIYTINYINPSWDEKFIIVSLSYSGKEISELLIINRETGERLPQILKNAWPASYLGISWLPDSSGFTYLYFTNPDSKQPNFKKNSQTVLYMLGQDPKKMNYIFGNKTHPELKIDATEYPITKIRSLNDKYIIGYIAGVNNFWRAFYTSIEDLKKGKIKWKPLHKKTDKIKTNKSLFKGDNYIYLTAKDADNFKLASVNVDSLNFNDQEIIFEDKEDEVIKTFKVNKDAIYVTTSKYGIEAKLYEVSKGKEREIKLPKKSGRISLSNKSTSFNDLWVSVNGWTSSNERYKYNSKTEAFTEDHLYDKVEYPEYKDIIVEEISIPSHDGVLVPLSIIYNKNIKKDGENPSLFYGYGAYGDNESPFFSTLFLNYVIEGGILCVAHVRGGGEKGEEWRKGGFKTTKPNTWKDLIACTEYMIENKFTSKQKTAIHSSSAGGIMVGRAMTERPDLFAAVISQVGTLNPIRIEARPDGGSTNIKEYGTLKDSIECMALLKMDSYLHIKDSVDYPATYLTVGMNDPRVAPWETGKFAARLQNANSLKRPVLLYADFDSGHGNNNSIKEAFKSWGNTFCFSLWQTGHPDYQLKK